MSVICLVGKVKRTGEFDIEADVDNTIDKPDKTNHIVNEGTSETEKKSKRPGRNRKPSWSKRFNL